MDILPRLPHAPKVKVVSGCIGGGLGVVATAPIADGELVEMIVLLRLLESYPGHDDPHVFVWWKGEPGKPYPEWAAEKCSTAVEENWKPPRQQEDDSTDTFGEVLFTKEDMMAGNICFAAATGNGAFYNTGPTTARNTRSAKDFDNDVCALYATRDIAAGEEVIIMYSSINWRGACWDELRTAVPNLGT
eukprot:CAMPEP_0198250578 /NCGR_PEP_ID=MMETSP1447-20131203/1710_1 /TAXON_ID=420782 /ORGANISM="Chaetoceros dichaeta, Strain CCMP1751" /LENGTH=188 /DNA_ID=CAMNT_0043935425 /DNA_START=72 /DNA_END=638 /DNA_ORIENTATION=+